MHDINGAELKAGDRVLVEFEVKACGGDTDFCNVTLATVHPMPGNGIHATLVLNTKQVGVPLQSTNPPV